MIKLKLLTILINSELGGGIIYMDKVVNINLIIIGDGNHGEIVNVTPENACLVDNKVFTDKNNAEAEKLDTYYSFEIGV